MKIIKRNLAQRSHRKGWYDVCRYSTEENRNLVYEQIKRVNDLIETQIYHHAWDQVDHELT